MSIVRIQLRARPGAAGIAEFRARLRPPMGDQTRAAHRGCCLRIAAIQHLEPSALLSTIPVPGAARRPELACELARQLPGRPSPGRRCWSSGGDAAGPVPNQQSWAVPRGASKLLVCTRCRRLVGATRVIALPTERQPAVRGRGLWSSSSTTVLISIGDALAVGGRAVVYVLEADAGYSISESGARRPGRGRVVASGPQPGLDVSEAVGDG